MKLSEFKKLVVHYLRNEIGEQYHLSGYDKSHWHVSMNKTIQRISSLQQDICKQYLEEMQHTKMHQGKGIGMSI